MENIELKEKDIPAGYALCFNDACHRKATCMHHQARLLKAQGHSTGQAVYPTAWQDGECSCYQEKGLVGMAWGFSHLYDNVPKYLRAEARQRVRAYFSAGNGPYYRVHHGENKLTPKQQADIMHILSQFGSTDGLRFDHYEMEWDLR